MTILLVHWSLLEHISQSGSSIDKTYRTTIGIGKCVPLTYAIVRCSNMDIVILRALCPTVYTSSLCLLMLSLVVLSVVMSYMVVH